MGLLAILISLASLALAGPVGAQLGAAPALAAPANFVALEGCETLDLSWDGVGGAEGYSIEVLAEYDSLSTACENAPDTPYLFRFSVDTTLVSIDHASFLLDVGSGLRAPCRIRGVRVRGLSGRAGDLPAPGEPFATAVPVPSCL